MKEKILAGCVILNEKGEVLLLHRKAGLNSRGIFRDEQWELPGGKNEDPEESLEETAVREVWEETGLSAKILQKIGECFFPEDDYILRYHWFLAEIVEGVPEIPEEEKKTFDNVQYFAWEELHQNKLPLSQNMRKLVAEYFQGKGTFRSTFQ
jgi:8-oxo-dGTP pyrophosphatase MutT (NUDIX family)